LEDFAHPEIREMIRLVCAWGIERHGPDFPRGIEHRKLWEVAMAARALADLGALHEGAEVLGVGAGTEPTLFWLTTRAARVFATDIYLDAGVSANEIEAARTMLTDPGRHWSGPWNPRRLVVQHMNALDLRYEDESFDGIFSSSSIEHFGSPQDVQRAAQEMFRVLKPGGILTVSTEFRLEGPPPGMPGCLMFDADMIREHIVGDLAWEPVSPLDLYISPATRRTEQLLQEAMHHSIYPQIVLRWEDRVFTSIHLALRKAGS
jgi:ubiquinone/menaquinone biosynthesis C-methylase UbiE